MVTATLLCAVWLGILLLQWGSRERKLADSSVLHLEKVYYGKPVEFDFDGWVGLLKKKLPQSLVKRFFKPPKMPMLGRSSWYLNTTIHTNEDALYFYFTRHDGSTGAMKNVGITMAQLVDEHGCVFQQTQMGGEDDGRLAAVNRTASWGAVSSVTWLRFEAFPRREKRFRLRVFTAQGDKIAEFTVKNPAPSLKTKKWIPATFPITMREGNLAFTLMALKISDHFFGNSSMENNQMRSFPTVVPSYEIIENGQASSNWQALDMELFDATGNFVGSGWNHELPLLCPQEPVWKLRVKFFGSEKSLYASNESWTLHGLEVPGPGKFTSLKDTPVGDGVILEPLFFAGVGDYPYSGSGEGLLEGSPLKEPEKDNVVEWGKGGGRLVHGKTPHLTLKIWALRDDERLTVRATDEQGRDFYGYEWMSWGGSIYKNRFPGEVHYLDKTYGSPDVTHLAFDLPPDVKKIDLTFCIHHCRTPEFIFKPPPVERTNSGTEASKPIKHSKARLVGEKISIGHQNP